MTKNKKSARDAGTSQGGRKKNINPIVSPDSEIVKMLDGLAAEQRSMSGSRIQLCPRCGWRSLNIEMTRNPISLHANIHICWYCLQDEIGLRSAGYPPKPLESWDCVRRMPDEKTSIRQSTPHIACAANTI